MRGNSIRGFPLDAYLDTQLHLLNQSTLRA